SHDSRHPKSSRVSKVGIGPASLDSTSSARSREEETTYAATAKFHQEPHSGSAQVLSRNAGAPSERWIKCLIQRGIWRHRGIPGVGVTDKPGGGETVPGKSHFGQLLFSGAGPAAKTSALVALYFNF